ncbi:MAG: hypothetical protein P8J20_10455 [Novosphingobium sp.]|nr:hypothetical protein [Novosphingobium sp.]
MDLSPDAAQFLDATRRDGWTPALKARFLALLADTGNVRLSARRCGLSAQSAYVQRRRDALFARGWAAAIMLARDHAEQVLADRAIEGVEERVYYRGELIATRRRYDSRLLLAHLARLDRLAGEQADGDEAERFDELLALVAGEEPPEALAALELNEILPAAREAYADRAAKRAECATRQELDEQEEAKEENEFSDLLLPAQEDEPEADDELDANLAAISEAGDLAWSEAAAQWDVWFDHACGVADRLVEVDPFPSDREAGSLLNSDEDSASEDSEQPLQSLLQDSVNLSTSPPALPAP